MASRCACDDVPVSFPRSMAVRLLPVARGGYVVLLAAAAVVAAVPFFDSPLNNDARAEGACAFMVLSLVMVPMWIAPVTIFTKQTVRVTANALVAETWRRRVVIDLETVRRVWACRMPTERRGTLVLGLHGEGGRRVWLVWQDSGGLGGRPAARDQSVGVLHADPVGFMAARNTSPWAPLETDGGDEPSFEETIKVVVAELSERPGVRVSPRVRALFELRGAPRMSVRVVLWLRAAALFAAWVAGITWAAVDGYLQLAATY